MRTIVIVLLVAYTASLAQGTSTTTGKAETKGACSPAVSGSTNTFNIECGIGQRQGSEIIAILNKIISEGLSAEAVMKKLDEILHAVNPNQAITVYDCYGRFTKKGPGANAAVEEYFGGDDNIPKVKDLATMYNNRAYADLTKQSGWFIQTQPEWLTPYLFNGLGSLSLGNKAHAKEMYLYYETRKGPAYETSACNRVEAELRQQLHQLGLLE